MVKALLSEYGMARAMVSKRHCELMLPSLSMIRLVPSYVDRSVVLIEAPYAMVKAESVLVEYQGHALAAILTRTVLLYVSRT